MEKRLHIADILIHLFFIVWLVMAGLFWQERLYGDAGFYIAKVVDYENFRLDLGRYILAFSQWLPLVLIKLHASLTTVLIGYSVGHVLFFYGIYLYCRIVLHSKEAGWMLLAMQLLGMGYAFTTQGFELYYAAGLSIILFLWLRQASYSTLQLIGIGLLSCFLIINYQLLLLPFAGFILWRFHEYRWQDKRIYLLVGSSLLLGILFKQYFLVFDYEQEKAAAFVQNLKEYDYSPARLLTLASFVFKFYWDVLLIIALSTFILLRQKRWAFGLGYLLFVGAGLLVATLSFPALEHSRYQEQCYFLFIFISCFPLIFFLLPLLKQRQRQMIQLLLSGLFIIRFFNIATAMEIFTQRVDFMHRLIATCQQRDGNKFVLEDTHAATVIVQPFFSFGMETMLLSAAQYPKTVTIVTSEQYNYGDNPQLLQQPHLYLSTKRSYYNQNDSIYTHQQANLRYYEFPKGNYSFLNTTSPPLEGISLSEAITLEGLILNESYPSAESIFLGLGIQNQSQQKIGSLSLKIAYQWWQDGQVIDLDWSGYQNPLEVDLLPHQAYQQTIRIHTPPQAGSYELQLIPVWQQEAQPNAFPKRYSIQVQ